MSRSFLTFLGFSIVATCLLFSDALVSGRVLSQADILFQHVPWSEHPPEGFVRAGNPLLEDVPTVFYPFLIHTATTLRSGALPVWSAALFGGHPFLASFQSATFSPFILPALVLDPAAALLAAAIAKLLVGGAGMWLLLRRLGLSPAGVWFGAAAYLLNPFSVVWAEHPVSNVSAVVPLLLWSLDRLVTSRAWRDVALLAVSACVVILAGHPETSYKVLLFAAVYGAAGTWSETAPGRGVQRSMFPALRAIGTRFIPAAILAFVLSAVQVVPFAEYLLSSQAWQMRHETPTNIYPAPAATAIAASIVPNFYGNPSHGDYFTHYNRHGTASNFCEQQMYPGMATWVLAIVGLHAWRGRWRARTLAACGLVSAALMFGVPIITALFLLVPGAGVIVLTRFGLVTITVAIILAAAGVDQLARESIADPETRARLPRQLFGICAAVLLVVLAWLLGAWSTLRAQALLSQTLGWSAWALVLITGASALVWARLNNRVGARVFTTIAIALVVVDLFALAWRYHPTVPRDQLYPLVPEIALVKADPGLFRVVGMSDAMAPNAAMAYGLQDLRGYDGVMPGLHADLVGTAHKGGSYRIVRPGDPFHVLDLMNVKYVFALDTSVLPADHFSRLFASGRSVLYRNDRVFPRAFLVGRTRVAEKRAGLRSMHAQQVDLRHEVMLAEPLPEAMRPDVAENGAQGSARVVRYEDVLVEIETEADGRRVLVLADFDYPGWSVTIDGAPAPLVRANYALRGVSVPAGRHRVTFHFDPLSVRLGAWLSLAGIVVAAAIAAKVGRTKSS